ncbi:hypothetical protein DFH28DRAFT_1167316 [Melampsora americana]|nr:hypothetical protein DFH28DRAFT_1167316 [Melampsora americana]
MTTATCGRCQRMEADPNSVCTLPQCLGCGKCYCYLIGSECRSCKESNDPQHTPAPPLTFTAPVLASTVTKTPVTASTIPQELFQGGISQPAFALKPNLIRNQSQVELPVPLNTQLQASIRASQSGRRTVGQPKGRKKKEVKEVKEDCLEIEISMTFLYLSGTGKSNFVRHGLTPRKFKINLDSSDWFWSLGWDVYVYYLQEAKDSAFPSKTQQRDNKICPLPSDFSSTYCIIADNGVSVTQESMKSTLLKTKNLNKTKFGLIFNMKKYLATLSSQSSPEPEKSSSQTRKRKIELSSEEEALDDSESDLSPEPKSHSHTQKRQRAQHSLDNNEHVIVDESHKQLVRFKPSRSTEQISLDQFHDQDLHRFEEELIHVESSLTVQHLQSPSIPGRDGSPDGPKKSASVQTLGNLLIHNILAGQLEGDEAMSLDSFGNTHELAPSAKEILPYPARSISNWSKGWLLSMITKNGQAVFKPVSISFRVD